MGIDCQNQSFNHFNVWFGFLCLFKNLTFYIYSSLVSISTSNSKVESFSWKTTLILYCPTALNVQMPIYYKVIRLLNGLLSYELNNSMMVFHENTFKQSFDVKQSSVPLLKVVLSIWKKIPFLYDFHGYTLGFAYTWHLKPLAHTSKFQS